MKTVTDELSTVASKSHAIGVQLGVPYDKLQAFKSRNETGEMFLAAIVNYWLKGNSKVPISWNSIVDALKSDFIGEVGLAKEIYMKYCQPKEYLGMIVNLYNVRLHCIQQQGLYSLYC